MNGFGCNKNSATLTVTNCREDAGVVEVDVLNIYPNPTEGVFELSFRTAAGPLSVAVTDVNGKVVYNENNENPDGFYKKEIDLKGMPQGNYIISVTQGERVFTQQISKQ